MNKSDIFEKYYDSVVNEVDTALCQFAETNNLSLHEALTSDIFLEGLAEKLLSLNESAKDIEPSIQEEFLMDYISFLSEACADCDGEDEKEQEDEGCDTDSDKDKEEMDEDGVQTKHKKSKMQSILDRKKYKFDFATKRKNKIRNKLKSARGGRPKDLKLSKAVKKAFNVKHLGKNWEEESVKEADDENTSVADDKKDAQKDKCDCGKADCPICNTKKKEDEGCDCKDKGCNEELQEKLIKAIQVESQVIKESISDALKKVPALGTLNEDDSQSVKSAIETIILEQVETRSQKMVEQLVKCTNDYITEDVMPAVEKELESVLENEILPEIDDSIDSYLTYMAEEYSDRLFQEKFIVKSKRSEMLESFADNLLNLIKTDLQIVPEQEDALIANEFEIYDLHESLDAARREKIKAQQGLNAALQKIYVLENMPNNLSENQKENFMRQIEAINESDFDKFKETVQKIFAGDKSQSNFLHENTPKPSNNTNTLTESEKRKEYLNSIVQAALKLA